MPQDLQFKITTNHQLELLASNTLFQQHFPHSVIGAPLKPTTFPEVQEPNRKLFSSLGEKGDYLTPARSVLVGEVWILWFAEDDPAQNGHMILTGLDVTNLVELQNQYIEVSAYSKAGFWRHDLVAESLHWSDEIFRIHGVTRETYTPELDSAINFYFENDAAIIAEHVERCMENKEPYTATLRIQRPDGKIVHVESKGEPEFNRDGEIIAISGTFRDRSQDAVAEEFVAAQQRQLDESLNFNHTLRVGLDRHALVSITNRRGIIQYANEKFCEVSGYSSHELIGQDHRILNSGFHDQSFFKELWHNISSGQIWQGEIRNQRKTGEHYWVRSTIVPFFNKETGEITQYLSVRTEITDQKDLQEKQDQLVHRLEDANAAKSKFLSNISHEFRTPLNHVLGFTQLLQLRKGNDDELNAGLANIKAGGIELLEKVEKILLFMEENAEDGKTSHRPYNLVEYFEETIVKRCETECANTSRSCTFTSTPDCQEFIARFNTENLQYIVNEIMTNFIRFTPVHSMLSISIHVSDTLADIEFSDNGPGFPDVVLTNYDAGFVIGEEGHTKANSGMGIGLSTISKLAKANKGAVSLSNKDGGACIRLRVPVSKPS